MTFTFFLGFFIGLMVGLCNTTKHKPLLHPDNRDRRASWAWLYYSTNEAKPNNWNWKWIEKHGTGAAS